MSDMSDTFQSGQLNKKVNFVTNAVREIYPTKITVMCFLVI